MTKHTPGPWLIGRGADGYPIIPTRPDSFSPSGQGVAHICKRTMSQEHLSNAHLIAAAPDLLAFAEATAQTFGEDTMIGKEARAAIARAKGE